MRAICTQILIYVNTVYRWRKTLAKQVKVTLSLREDFVRRAKSKLAMEGRSLSDAVEELLLTYDELHFLDKLCEAPKSRPIDLQDLRPKKLCERSG